MVVLGLLAFWSAVAEQTDFGALYSDVFILVFVLFTLAVIVPKYFDFHNLAPKGSNIPLEVGIGALLLG